jgi:gliding motility-associated-like protein
MPVSVTGVTASPTTATIAAGATQQLTATIAPSNATNQAVTWSSSNTAVATVSATGLVSGVTAGAATITVTTTDGAKTASSTITVTGSTTTYYNIVNRWQATTYLYDSGNGKVSYGTTPSGNNNYQWAQVSAGSGFIYLKNRATGNLMNVETQNGSVECNAANTSWYSAMWSLNATGDGWDYIANRWQTSEWVHIENLLGYAQYASPQTGWYSAEWQFVNPVTVPGGMNSVYEIGVAEVQPINLSSGAEPLVNPALSPNGDGINDFLSIKNIENFPENKLSVMNAGGVKVFESLGYDNMSKIFDGHTGTGALMPRGTYFYMLQYKDKVSGAIKSKTGFLVLKY